MKLGDIEERKLSGGEKRSKEAHFKKLKKHKDDFSDRYGDEAEGIMHAIATKRAKGESVDEGWEELPPINREKYGNRERDGLEGPIQTRSGKTIYYDTKQGMYYDPDTDMYISYDDFKMLDKKGMHMVGKATNRHDNIPEAVGDAAEAFYRLQDEFAGEEARGAHKVLIDELIRYLSVDQVEDFVADFRRHYDMNESVSESKLTEGVLDDADEDGWMAKSQLYKLAKYAINLHGMISDTDNLEPWVQSKITRASEDMSSVKHYMEYNAMSPRDMPQPEMGPEDITVEGMDDVDEHKTLAMHLTQMAKQDDAEDGMDGDYFRDVARAVMGHDPMEIRAAILDGDTEPRERVIAHLADEHPEVLKEIFPRDSRNPGYAATMRESEENHYMCVHAKKGTMKCTASSSYEAAKKAAEQWKMKSTAGIDAHLMTDEPKTATEGHSPHKKGSAKYKKHMAAKHASMAEGTVEQLEKQAIDFFTSIKSKIGNK